MDEKIDVLDRGSFVERLESLVEMLSKNKQGCCFGLNGPWGCGKSYVLNMFEKKIRDVQSEETFNDRYFVFHYNCWEYDYYEEPAIAIIAAMLDVTDKEINILTKKQRNLGKKAAWETTKETLTKVAKELSKNKIGIDVVDIVTKTVDEYKKNKDDDYDSLYGFKKALEETRKGMCEIAERKTIVVIVDELDRCLPEYTIKVLERLHHIFTGLENIIVIVSMDKKQIEHSIKEIYGDIEVDTYLRKLISFKINLNKGKATRFLEKYETYASMFEIKQEEESVIEDVFKKLMYEMDIRTQERIFHKAEIIHRLVKNEDVTDSSLMTFEILILTLAIKTKSNNINWLIDSYMSVPRNTINQEYEDVIRGLVANAKSNYSHGGKRVVTENIIGKTVFWVASLYYNYNNGVCGPYYYKKEDTVTNIEIVKKIAEYIEIVDCD